MMWDMLWGDRSFGISTSKMIMILKRSLLRIIKIRCCDSIKLTICDKLQQVLQLNSGYSIIETIKYTHFFD